MHPSDWLNYKQLRNEVTLELKAKRKSYFSQKTEESQGNIKETWKVLNAVMGRKSKTTVINSLEVNSDTITEYHEPLFLFFNDYLYKKAIRFKPKYSTQSVLLNTSSQWLLNTHKGDYNLAVFLDLRKAFDTVNHNLLLKKLTFYGIQGIELQWFES